MGLMDNVFKLLVYTIVAVKMIWHIIHYLIIHYQLI